MIDHEEKIKDALEGIPGLKSLTGTWPNDQTRYPAIVVQLASEGNHDHRDDRAYLVEMVYYLRIFDTDPTKKRMKTILQQVDSRMEAIGYHRTFRFEQNDAQVKQWVTHYTAFVPVEEQEEDLEEETENG